MLEICLDGFSPARAAGNGGADRVELCANLPEVGMTPSAAVIRAARRVLSGGLMVIICPRGDDFLYSEDEMEVMLEDIRVSREYGADGVVIGWPSLTDAGSRSDTEESFRNRDIDRRAGNPPECPQCRAGRHDLPQLGLFHGNIQSDLNGNRSPVCSSRRHCPLPRSETPHSPPLTVRGSE